MTGPTRPEVWLRGPVEGVPPSLQPVAHALMQAVEDVERLTDGLTAEELWRHVGGAATIGFHLRHMTGSLDRLLTYARGESLTDEQRSALRTEKQPAPDLETHGLVRELSRSVDSALAQLRSTREEDLDTVRSVGSAGLPSTARGLLYHAGEHTSRHAGQIATTVRALRG